MPKKSKAPAGWLDEMFRQTWEDIVESSEDDTTIHSHAIYRSHGSNEPNDTPNASCLCTFGSTPSIPIAIGNDIWNLQAALDAVLHSIAQK
jgi:hypothetical protein